MVRDLKDVQVNAYVRRMNRRHRMVNVSDVQTNKHTQMENVIAFLIITDNPVKVREIIIEITTEIITITIITLESAKDVMEKLMSLNVE